MPDRSALVISEFHLAYVNLIKEEDVNKALRKNSEQFRKFLKKIPGRKIDHAYGEGKWTIREVLQHLIDAERVFSYRALRFARKDATPLPGFDENAWAAASGASNRKWKDLVEEFKTVRNSTLLLFDSLDDSQLTYTGEANGKPLNALGIGFIIAGHTAHHMKIIKERYL